MLKEHKGEHENPPAMIDQERLVESNRFKQNYLRWNEAMEVPRSRDISHTFMQHET